MRGFPAGSVAAYGGHRYGFCVANIARRSAQTNGATSPASLAGEAGRAGAAGAAGGRGGGQGGPRRAGRAGSGVGVCAGEVQDEFEHGPWGTTPNSL